MFMNRLLICLVIFFCFSAVTGQTVSQVEKKRGQIKESIESLADTYADVPPTYSCKKPKSAYDKIICADKDMQLLEKLYRMAAVYAYENATKSETNHKTFKNWEGGISLRNKLKNQKAVTDYLIDQINNSLGGLSPFQVD